jgi:hypothetical protein
MERPPWRSDIFDDMTSIHDSMLAVYRGQTPDRIPVGIYERYLPRGSIEREVRELGLGLIAYVPVVTMLGPPWHLYPGYISEISGAEASVSYRWDGGAMVECRKYVTPVGSVTQEVTHDGGGVGSEHIRKHYIGGRDDYRTMQYLVEHTVLRRNEGAIAARMADLGGDGIVFGRLERSPYQKCLIEWAGPERFLIDLHTDPEPVQELLEALFRKQEESWALALDSQVEVFWQPDNITSLMTPPGAFRKYHLPFYRQRAKDARAAGKPFLVHMDGRIKALAPLIRESGIDVVESLSLPDIGGDMTLTEARAAVPETVLVPNFPANWCTRSEAEIENSLATLLDEAGRAVPFMLQVSEDLPLTEWQRVVPLLMRTVAGYARSRR